MNEYEAYKFFRPPSFPERHQPTTKTKHGYVCMYVSMFALTKNSFSKRFSKHKLIKFNPLCSNDITLWLLRTDITRTH